MPQEIAQEVSVHSRAILIADMKSRRRHYETLGIEMDETVDWESVEVYYEELDRA